MGALTLDAYELEDEAFESGYRAARYLINGEA